MGGDGVKQAAGCGDERWVGQMASVETTQLPEVKIRVAPPQGVSLGPVAQDIATMSGGTALAALFNTLLVFLIPRLVSVEDFGYWRLFLLYASYAGLLHLGFADGALLRWAGRPLADFRHEIGPSMKFLLWQHLAFVLPAGVIVVLLLPSPLGLIGVAILLLALIMNLATVLQYGLQGARQFKPVALATAAPAGAFVLLAFLWRLRAAPSFRGLIVLYCASWAGVLIYLWIRVRPGQGAYASDSAWSLGKTCIKARGQNAQVRRRSFSFCPMN
jgi:hypothetical protein